MKSSRIFDVMAAVSYKAILDVLLLAYVLPMYETEPFYAEFGHAAPWKLAFGYLLVALAAAAMSAIREDAIVSRFVVTTQLVFIVIPFLTIFGSVDLPLWFLFPVGIGYWILVFCAEYLPHLRFRNPSRGVRLAATFLLVCVGVYTYVAVVRSGGLSRFNLNIADVYKYREQLAKVSSTLLSALVPTVGYVLNMAVVVVAMRPNHQSTFPRRAALLVGACTIQIFLFGMTGFKAFLFLPFAVIGILELSKRVSVARALLIFVPIAALALLLVTMWFDYGMGAAMLERGLFVPAGLHSLYFEYFSTHPFMFFTSHVFGSLFDTYSSGQSAVGKIAMFYWGRSFSPNVGWVGAAYAGFGMFGVLIFGLLLGVLMRIGDGLVTRKTPRGAAEGLLVGACLALASSALLTVIETDGLAVALFVLWLLGGYYQRGAEVSGRRVLPALEN